jgi:ABC-2 type transport system ATP-binding protein
MININSLDFYLGAGVNEKRVLKDVNLTFLDGKINCLVGPNGSGKTTLFRILSDMYDLDKLALKSLNVKPNELKKLIYFVQDSDRIEVMLTGREYINFSLDLQGINPKNVIDKINYFIELYDMSESIDNLVTNYSHGMVKKLTLIVGFVIGKDFIILDEPFNGLDPEFTLLTEKVLLAIVAKGKTVVLSSHNLDIVEKIADRLVIMIEGKIEFEGGLGDYLKESKTNNLYEGWLELVSKRKSKIYDFKNLDQYL